MYGEMTMSHFLCNTLIKHFSPWKDTKVYNQTGVELLCTVQSFQKANSLQRPPALRPPFTLSISI